MGAQAVRLSNVDIDNALKNKDFEVLFQPIFDLGNGALARVETFIRWRHPSLGVLPPGAFISFFETQGRMSELTRYVLAEALSTYQAWRGPFPPGFSINLALSDLSDESFASHLTVLLRDSGFPIELVTLECPMPPVDADLEATVRQLQRLSETGARLAIEVRGRANDFLKTVHPFPFAEIKTGGAAILRFARTVRGPGLSAISELLELASEQKAAITAVGVEDQASLAALRGLGFAAAQGNHLGKVGQLTQFMPSHVNDVRALLGLEPLSSGDLAALFRTGAPQFAAAAPAAAEPDLAPATDEAEPPHDVIARRVEIPSAQSEDELVERLAARIARVDGASPRQAAGETSAEARAAAIARARRKSLARERLASRNALKSKAEAREEIPAPLDMQERLSREFAAFAEVSPPPDEIGNVEALDETARQTAVPETGDDMTAGFDETPARPAPLDQRAPVEAMKEAHLAVPGASAHFKPTIRVMGPEMREASDVGDLHRVEAFGEAHETPALREGPAAAPVQQFIEAPQEQPVEEIPEVRPGAQWVEDTVAVEAPATPARKRKNFLTRTVIPYSALRITHFWPRARRARPAKAAE
jgi:EAL domain-containing protein (putative c-di-GMP-specific phosphodiesterase class I)